MCCDDKTKKKPNGWLKLKEAQACRRMAKCVLNYFLIREAWQRSLYGSLHVSSISCHSASLRINLINKELKEGKCKLCASPKNTQSLWDDAMRGMSGNETTSAPTFYKFTIQLSLRSSIPIENALIEVFDEIKSTFFVIFVGGRDWSCLCANRVKTTNAESFCLSFAFCISPPFCAKKLFLNPQTAHASRILNSYWRCWVSPKTFVCLAASELNEFLIRANGIW